MSKKCTQTVPTFEDYIELLCIILNYYKLFLKYICIELIYCVLLCIQINTITSLMFLNNLFTFKKQNTMNTAPEVKTLGSTVERLKTNRNELAELCSDFVTFAGVALPVRIMTDLLESYLCDEDRTPEQIKEVTTIMTNHISFIVSLGENDHELKLLDSLLKIESHNFTLS